MNDKVLKFGRLWHPGRLMGLLLLACLLLISVETRAGFEGAIEGLQKNDFELMMNEVRNGVNQGNDDGLILFLSLLEQYPHAWRQNLDEGQRAELFKLLEEISLKSDLQAQYRLALIPRKHIPIGNSPEANEERNALVKRLKPIAEKGYSYAAFGIFLIHSNRPQSEYDQADTMKWLHKSGELGHTVGAFMLGMKYLNIVDDYFGCFSFAPHRCLQRNEEKGWYWMQQAARRIEPHNFTWNKLALQMGKLYRTGIADQPADPKQAYAWYLTAMHALGPIGVFDQVLQELQQMKAAGQLEEVDPEIGKICCDRAQLFEALHAKKSFQKPRLLATEDMKLFRGQPVFSYVSLSWIRSIQKLDVYADGRVNLLITPHWWQDLDENYETWKRLDRQEFDEFLNEVNKLASTGRFKSGGDDLFFCEDGCPEATHNLFTFSIDGVNRSALMINRNLEIENPDLAAVLTLIEKYFDLQGFLCDVSNGQDEKHCNQLTKTLQDANKEEK
jgi:hypothetical protein